MSYKSIARVCHEVNRAYCESLGDYSQPTWENAPEWQKKSAIAGVKFSLKNPNATPEDSHNSWLKEKTKEGWKYGPIKDVDLREHPCFLPYDQLPKDQQTKDHLFQAVVRALT